MGILAKPLGWLLSLLYGVVGNYGISIVIITVIVKLSCILSIRADHVYRWYERHPAEDPGDPEEIRKR